MLMQYCLIRPRSKLALNCFQLIDKIFIFVFFFNYNFTPISDLVCCVTKVIKKSPTKAILLLFLFKFVFKTIISVNIFLVIICVIQTELIFSR